MNLIFYNRYKVLADTVLKPRGLLTYKTGAGVRILFQTVFRPTPQSRHGSEPYLD